MSGHAEPTEASWLDDNRTNPAKMLRQAQHDISSKIVYVYILTNPTKAVLYIGVINDLTRRLFEHSEGRGNVARFSGKYQADLLIYSELCADAPQAITREKQLKGWTQSKKEALINGFNPDWKEIDLETWEG